MHKQILKRMLSNINVYKNMAVIVTTVLTLPHLQFNLVTNKSIQRAKYDVMFYETGIYYYINKFLAHTF